MRDRALRSLPVPAIVGVQEKTPDRPNTAKESKEIDKDTVEYWEPSVANKSIPKAPVRWLIKTKSDGVNCALADDANVWCGTGNGTVYQLSHDGAFRDVQRVSSAVRTFAVERGRVFVGCIGGTVEQLTLNGPSIIWKTPGGNELRGLALFQQTLVVHSVPNRITVLNQSGRVLWEREVRGYASLMVQCDEDAIYVADFDETNGTPVTAHSSKTGDPLWSVPGVWAQAGTLMGAFLVVGTVAGEVVALNKSNGARVWARKTAQQVISCATGGNAVFAGDLDRLYAWGEHGEELWQMVLPASAEPTHICRHGDHLYVASATGSLACVNLNPVAIEDARNGRAPRARVIKAPASTG